MAGILDSSAWEFKETIINMLKDLKDKVNNMQ